MIKEVLGKQIYYFGYSNTPADKETPNNETPFFDYGENHNIENANKFMQFRELNKKSIEQVCAKGSPNKYYVNTDVCGDAIKPDELVKF